MIDFSSWSHANLVKFARATFKELQELKLDLKDAIEAYRKLNKEKENEKDSTTSTTD